MEQLDAYRIVVPLRTPYRTATTRLTHRDVVLVAVRSGPLTGWGEAAPVPGYSPVSTDDVWDEIETLGRSVPGPPALDTVSGPVRAAVRGAVADLGARVAKRPLWETLGCTGSPVPMTAVIGIPATADALAQAVAAGAAAGLRSFKIKVRPGWDVEPLTAARSAAPDAILGADANGSYPDAGSVPDAIDDLGLAYLEQPFAPGRPDEHRRLQERVSAVVCLDEDVEDPQRLADFLDRGAARGVVVKPSRAGGADAALALLRVASEHGASARVGGMLETGIGRAHMLALASHPGFDLPGDIGPPAAYLAADPATGPWHDDDGRLRPPPGPGLGVSIDPAVLDRVTVAHRAFP